MSGGAEELLGGLQVLLERPGQVLRPPRGEAVLDVVPFALVFELSRSPWPLFPGLHK
jgi:hypothetical protein